MPMINYFFLRRVINDPVWVTVLILITVVLIGVLIWALWNSKG